MVKREKTKKQLLEEIFALKQKIVTLEQKQGSSKKSSEDACVKEDITTVLLNAAVDSTILVDRKGTILSLNDIAAERIGKSKEELVGTIAYHFLPKKTADIRKKHINKVLRAGKPVHFKDEREGRFYDCRIYPVFDQDGRITRAAVFARDITEQLHSEKALRNSEARYHSLISDVLDSSGEGLFILDAMMKVVWLNQAMERYFGIKRLDVIGKDMRTIIQGGIKNIFEEPEIFVQKVFAAYNDNTYLETFDCHVLPGKGRDERWLEHRSQPIRSGLYAGGRIEHYYNITDLKQTQQELSKHRDRLQERVSEKTIELISTNTKLQQQITERLSSEAALKKRSHDLWIRIKELNCLYGISKLIQEPSISLEEIITGIVNLIPPAWQYPEITCARVILDKQFKTKNFSEKPWKQTSEIFVHNEKAGLIEVCYLEKKPTSDEGPFLKEQGILLNAVAEWLGKIIEHKQVDEALKISHAAIDSSLSPIALADITGRLTYVNPSFLKLLGYASIKDVIGKAVMSFCSSEKKALEVMEILQKTGKWMGELPAIKADGSSLDVFVSANIVVDKDDTPVCLMVSYIDMTQQKQLQNKLIRSERLAATGQLAASVAHEINSPLQAMTVLLSTIRSKYKDDSELLENITLLKTGMISIRDTVRNLLDLSRPWKEKKQPTDVNNLINNTITLVQSTLKKK